MNLEDLRRHSNEHLFTHMRRFSLAFELLQDALVCAIYAEPLDVVVLVHKFDARGDTVDD